MSKCQHHNSVTTSTWYSTLCTPEHSPGRAQQPPALLLLPIHAGRAMTCSREETRAHSHLVSKSGLMPWLDVTPSRCDKMEGTKCSKSLVGTGANSQETLEMVSVKFFIAELHPCILTQLTRAGKDRKKPD